MSVVEGLWRNTSDILWNLFKRTTYPLFLKKSLVCTFHYSRYSLFYRVFFFLQNSIDYLTFKLIFKRYALHVLSKMYHSTKFEGKWNYVSIVNVQLSLKIKFVSYEIGYIDFFRNKFIIYSASNIFIYALWIINRKFPSLKETMFLYILIHISEEILIKCLLTYYPSNFKIYWFSNILSIYKRYFIYWLYIQILFLYLLKKCFV